MAKSQITLYIILGLIIVVAVGTIYLLKDTYMTGETPSDTYNKEVIALNKYIESYLEDISIEAMFVAARQGGYIGSIERTYFKELNNGDKVSVGIMHIPRSMYGIYLLHGYRYALGLPLYPWVSFPDIAESRQIQPYAFGKITTPELMNWTQSSTISKEIEGYINNKFDELNLNKSFGDVFYIEQNGDISSSVIITNKSFAVLLVYPLILKYKGTNTTVLLDAFYIIMPSKFSSMYKFINELLVRDNTDIDFNIATDYKQLDSYSPEYILDVDYDFKTGYDLIKIKYQSDSFDRFDGLLFRTVRENRIPALLPLVPKSPYNLDYNNLGSFCKYSDSISNYIIEPKGKDPDEDEVLIRYDISSGCNFLSYLDKDTGDYSITCGYFLTPAKTYDCTIRISAYDESDEIDKDYQEISFGYTCGSCCMPIPPPLCGVCTPCTGACPCGKYSCPPPLKECSNYP